MSLALGVGNANSQALMRMFELEELAVPVNDDLRAEFELDGLLAARDLSAPVRATLRGADPRACRCGVRSPAGTPDRIARDMAAKLISDFRIADPAAGPDAGHAGPGLRLLVAHRRVRVTGPPVGPIHTAARCRID